jgi:hypothetical protein
LGHRLHCRNRGDLWLTADRCVDSWDVRRVGARA